MMDGEKRETGDDHDDDHDDDAEKQKLQAAARKVMMYQRALSLSQPCVPSSVGAGLSLPASAQTHFRHSLPYPLRQEPVSRVIADIDIGGDLTHNDIHLEDHHSLGAGSVVPSRESQHYKPPPPSYDDALSKNKYLPFASQGHDESRSPSSSEPHSEDAAEIWQPRIRRRHSGRDRDEQELEMLHDPDLSALTPAERRNLFKTQSSRDRYISNGNNEEIEMVGIRRSEGWDDAPIETDLDACDINFSAASIDSVAPVEKPEPDLDVEDGRRRGREQQSYDDEECENCGPLNGPCTILLRFYLRTKHRLVQRVGPCGGFALTAAGFVLLMGVAIFLGVFPRSFRYINYYEYALVQNSITNSVDRDTTYYPGCYVLFPAAKLITYNSTAHYVSKTMGIFTSDKLSISLSFHLQYFLKPEELGKLHAKFELDYDDVLQSIIVSTIRNEAGLHRIDDYRHKRSEIETRMHLLLRRRLGGDCCETCCPSRCKNYTLSCQGCWPVKDCDKAYHVDVRYFQMAAISIVDYVSERYMRQTLLKVEAEREYFLQEHTVTEKVTELLTKRVYNKALEIENNATAVGNTIRARATAEKFGRVQKAYTEALKSLYDRLNVTQESHKLSLMLIRSLEDIQPNLYTGYGFDVNKLYSP